MQSCTGEWRVNRGVDKWEAKEGIFNSFAREDSNFEQGEKKSRPRFGGKWV
jgi:hypothetical protein